GPTRSDPASASASWPRSWPAPARSSRGSCGTSRCWPASATPTPTRCCRRPSCPPSGSARRSPRPRWRASTRRCSRCCATRWRGMSTRRRWVLGVALGLLASAVLLGAVYLWWLGGGLLRVYTTGQAKADIAQKQLKLMQKSITAGDDKGARRHLGIAERAVNDAETAARAPQVRVAKWLPYTRGTVSDLDHLLGAASVVIDAAD